MFNIYNRYHSAVGGINFSQALTYSEFRGKSRGIGLKYVQEGQENYVVQEHRLSVRKGQWMLVRDEGNFEVYSEKKVKVVNGICVDFDTDLLLQAHSGFEHCDLLFNTPFYCGPSSLGPSIFRFFDPFSSMGQSNEQNELAMRRVLDGIVAFAGYIHEIEGPLSVAVKHLEVQRQLLARLLYTKDYIHQYYHTKLPLGELARVAGLSKYHFHRLFQLCFRCSPKDLQIQLRMDRAKELLAQGDLPIYSIAYQLGYTDTAAFSNQFKRYHQQTPFQYRGSL
ncbi:MAG: AraC family transcriptional regulator [Bacteroidota bacterium]